MKQFKKIRAKCKKIFRKKPIRFVLFSVVIVFLVTGIFFTARTLLLKPSATTKSPQLVTEQDKTAQVPFFETIIPIGKTIEQLGGWTRISPPDKNAVFAFVDSIDNNRIVVGQQPMPEDFKEETEEQLESLAKTYKTSEKVTVNGITIHFATSAKGPQSVLFIKNGLLVTIRSSVTIPQDKWIDYISSLQ